MSPLGSMVITTSAPVAAFEHAVGAGGGDIEPRHIMPGRDQICGHRRAHIS